MVAEIPADHPPYPLHPSVRDRLHPDYVSFYNKYLLYQTPTHYRSIESSRQGVPVSNSCTTNPNPKPNRIPGESAPLPVGSIKDFSVPRRETAGPEIPIRCFTPGGEAPVEGWPLVLYFHGGGWVFGDIGSENTLCSHMCARARSVVITVDYRSVKTSSQPNPWICICFGFRPRLRWSLCWRPCHHVWLDAIPYLVPLLIAVTETGSRPRTLTRPLSTTRGNLICGQHRLKAAHVFSI